MYIWRSNLFRVGRTDDIKNRRTITNNPVVHSFFEGKNPVYIYSGPRHSAVIIGKTFFLLLENGDLYTFGTGKEGVLGHGDDNEIVFPNVKKVEFFEKNKIKIKKICLGDFHSMALTEDGEIYTWGYGGKKGLFGIFIRGFFFK